MERALRRLAKRFILAAALTTLAAVTGTVATAQVAPLSQSTSCDEPTWNARYGIFLELYEPAIALNADLIYDEINAVNKKTKLWENALQIYGAYNTIAGTLDIETAKDATASALDMAGGAVGLLGADAAHIVAEQMLEWGTLGLKRDPKSFADYIVGNTLEMAVGLYGTVGMNTLLREYRMLAATSAALHSHYRRCGDRQAVERDLNLTRRFEDVEESLAFLPWAAMQYDPKGSYSAEAQRKLSDMIGRVLTGVNDTRESLSRGAVASATPDLEPYRLRVQPGTTRPGGEIRVSFRVHNDGGAGARASQARLRLSTSREEITTSDPELLSVEVPALGSEETANFEESAALPPDLSAGTYYAWLILDVNSEAGQTPADEENDKSYEGLAVERFSPDLRTRDVDLSTGVASPGDEIGVAFEVRNEGRAAAQPSKVRIRLGQRSDRVTTQDLELVTTNLPALDVDASTTIEERVRLPDDLPAGEYYAWVILDVESGAGQTPAGEESDKARTRLAIRHFTPDLRPRRMDVTPRSTQPGSEVKIEFRVDNQGKGTARASRARIRLSVNRERMTVQDQELATIEVPVLPGRESLHIEKDLRLPQGLEGGTYYVWIIMDVDGRAGQTFADEHDDKTYHRVRVEN